MIHVQEISKAFKGRAAVRGLSFSANDGAITGLLGANGAGKSTTLRMICGVLRPDAGVVQTGGPERVGALLDHCGIYGRLTARENLIYFGRLRGIPPRDLERRVREVLALLGLGPVADRRRRVLPGGADQNGAGARHLALAAEPGAG